MNTQWVWRNNAISKERSTKGHYAKQTAPASLQFHLRSLKNHVILRYSVERMYKLYFKLPWSSMFASNPKARSRNVYECCSGIFRLLRWGGWSYLWAVETRCSSHLICFLFGSGFNGSSVEPSFSPAPVTQWVNAGLKSHWLMLSDSGWQLQGEYWSFYVGLWWSLCE